jgi:hypothetical protein
VENLTGNRQARFESPRLFGNPLHPFPLDLFPAIGATQERVAANKVEFKVSVATHRKISARSFALFPAGPKNSMVSMRCHSRFYILSSKQ